MNPREVEAAVAQLEEHVRRGKSPDLHLARLVLLTLGRSLGAPPVEACSSWLERTRAAGRAAGGAWDEAVRDELTLAVGEFAQCVDPRYLDLPRYDMEYTRAARARLEDRLRAARELGFAPSSREAEVLALADRVLASAEERLRRNLEGPHDPAAEPCAGTGRSSRKRRPKS